MCVWMFGEITLMIGVSVVSFKTSRAVALSRIPLLIEPRSPALIRTTFSKFEAHAKSSKVKFNGVSAIFRCCKLVAVFAETGKDPLNPDSFTVASSGHWRVGRVQQAETEPNNCKAL